VLELLASDSMVSPPALSRLSYVLQTLIADVASGEILGRLYFSLYLIAIGLA